MAEAPQEDWRDRLRRERPEALVMARWLYDLLDGRDPSSLTHNEFCATQTLTNTLFEAAAPFARSARGDE